MEIINPKLINQDEIASFHELKKKLLLMHFSPKRTDCVELDYNYRLFGNKAYLIDSHHDIELTDEINAITFKDLAHEYGLTKQPSIDYEQFIFDNLKDRH